MPRIEILKTENEDLGFYGTIVNPKKYAWDIAFRAISEDTGADSLSVQQFLDSRYGRHFADEINSNLRSLSIDSAIELVTAKWMSWKISRRTARDLNIEPGIPYLTGFVRYCGR